MIEHEINSFCTMKGNLITAVMIVGCPNNRHINTGLFLPDSYFFNFVFKYLAVHIMVTPNAIFQEVICHTTRFLSFAPPESR